MTPIRRWPPRNQKLSARAPFGTWRMLTFLPPYSPDLNPIENVFAKLETRSEKPMSTPPRQHECASDRLLTPSPKPNSVTANMLHDSAFFHALVNGAPSITKQLARDQYGRWRHSAV